jgi:Tol biopolymer transport system component
MTHPGISLARVRYSRYFVLVLLIMVGLFGAAERWLFPPKPAMKVASIFSANTAKDEEIEISEDIMRNLGIALERDNRFQTLSPTAVLERIGNPDIGATPKFAKLQAVNLAHLVIGRVASETNGQFKIAFRLWDVTRETPMLGQIIFTADRTRIAGYISDVVAERLEAAHK